MSTAGELTSASPLETIRVERIDPGTWRDRAVELLAGGARFLSLYASGRESPVVRAVFESSELTVLETVSASVPSIVDLAPAATWDEREAHDLFAIEFPAHEPLRPLVDHPDDLAAWTIAVHGHDPHQVAVGPIHAGIIESGHFRFHNVGERILHVDIRLFYKHRGLERLAEQLPVDEAIRVAQRACAACAVANSVAFAQACEQALGLRPDDGLAAVRTVLLELERIWNHLNDISAVCAGIGFAPGSMAFAALKERAQRVNAQIAGHRFLFDTVSIGRSPLELNQAKARQAHAELRTIQLDAARAWREVRFNGSVQARLDGVGALTRDQAIALGTVGPAARAAGVAFDRRSSGTRLAYSGFVPAAPASPTGDVRARLELRATELDASFAVLDQLLARRLDAPVAHPCGPIGTPGFAAIESPRGETVCSVHLEDGERVARLHLRTGSYANWPSVAAAATDNLLPDFPLINKSFELCYSCADR